MLKEIKKAFTLAEVLIVIGIIGVVAALTLPNLNHATGDKETVTRLQKAYSILNEANDRAVAIYGPISSWKSNEQCADELNVCWMKRIGEFLKFSQVCDQTDMAITANIYKECDFNNNMGGDIVYQLPDGVSFYPNGYCSPDCDCGPWGWNNQINDICIEEVFIDINGPLKGKNELGKDIFQFELSSSIGLRADSNFADNYDDAISDCMSYKNDHCSFWVLEYGNLDYLKADENGKCNDSNIILDGVTNTSCH